MSRKEMTMAMMIMFMFSVLSVTVAKPQHKKYFSKKVDVTIKETEEVITVFIGNLEIGLVLRDDLINSSVARNISEEVFNYLGGTLFTGVVKERRGCVARMFIKDGELLTGNIDCKRKHFVVEKIDKQYVMSKKPHRPQKQRDDKEECSRRDQKFCTLFIQTDPYFWKHVRSKHDDADQTKEAILRTIIDHVLAANELYEKYNFPGENFTHPGLQFVLAGFQIDDDSLCEEVNDYVTDEVDYVGDLYDYGDYPTYYLNDEEEYDDSDVDYVYQINDNFINDQDYNDWNETEEGYQSILDMLSDPFNKSHANVDLSDSYIDYQYEDEDFNYEDAYKEDNAVVLNGENCYEDINGTVDIATEFCKPFGIHQSTLFLNMFSTVDHSKYCLAHIWTYRDMEVVGLADNPTEGAIGLSGYCAEYDEYCQIGFNTGLVSFRHLGNQLSLADSQDTFIHELGHSFGAAHDPRQDSKCAPGGNEGNFLMYPGPLGNSFIRREFSPCSKFEIGMVMDETMHSCLLTRDELISEDLEAEKITEVKDKTECDPDKIYKQLRKIGMYLVDLKQFIVDKKRKKILFRLNRKFKQIFKSFEDSQTFDSIIKHSLNRLFQDVNSNLGVLEDELEIFLARKISNISKSIVRCLQ